MLLFLAILALLPALGASAAGAACCAGGANKSGHIMANISALTDFGQGLTPTSGWLAIQAQERVGCERAKRRSEAALRAQVSPRARARTFLRCCTRVRKP